VEGLIGGGAWRGHPPKLAQLSGLPLCWNGEIFYPALVQLSKQCYSRGLRCPEAHSHRGWLLKGWIGGVGCDVPGAADLEGGEKRNWL
jgi:hypothetical protein